MDRQRSSTHSTTLHPTHTHNHSMVVFQSQPQSQHLLQQQQQQLDHHHHQQSPHPRKNATPQVEYFDISRNQPSTKSHTLPTTYLNSVKGFADKLDKVDMKRVNVERWLREKYNREHPDDKILHPRGFKFTDEQRRQLMEFFEHDRYPKPHDMQILAYELNVKKEQVKNWFHDQRRKCKRLEQLAINTEAKKIIKSKYTKQQRQKLEEFFEKNFHPFPGDSRRIVNEIESRGSLGGRSRYEKAPMSYSCVDVPSNKVSVQSRGFKFSENQRHQLKESYLKNRYPSTSEMERLAHNLGVRRVQIKNWFHDQRRKEKRQGTI